MSDLRKLVFDQSHKRGSVTSKFSIPKPDFTPLKWNDYFDKEEFIETSTGSHHIFVKGSTGPIILCLHGGGYNGLTWALFTKEIFANLECQIVALDFRGHGKTKTNNDTDLSLETLSMDVVDVANTLAEREKTSIVLVGHSMGGAIAVSASYKIDSLVGLCVIDVVEGTALDALSSMQSILRGRPTHFKSIPHAIQWCMETGELACDEWETFDKIDAKCIDIPCTTKFLENDLSLKEVDEEPATATEKMPANKPPLPHSDKHTNFKIPENQNNKDGGPKYTWRIDLSKTEPFWHNWFQGLSERFLGCKVPRVLILANIHGLDTKLTVGQMQGKFQLQVLAKTGHAVHEDQPHQVAEILSIYLVKQKCTQCKPGFSMPLYPNTCC
ncbi:protein phosphatase methylesterase 1 isoform X2 [Anthonomus grandis grandis]|uniref:protein phosphatase methylesterase 1 isoform X2 n=1 Tax=Anthonomus grandis grandis TaxID=2921223 RepID=UPI002165E775|nr:protein phosphatase methylesterase 1 isoform X2 [Anthonomus grandis grandis]